MKINSVITVCFLLLTAWAAGETPLSPLEALQKENAALRSEIIRINAELTLMKQWLAGMVSGEKELDKNDALDKADRNIEQASDKSHAVDKPMENEQTRTHVHISQHA
ncbi:MAG: hypothetical protein IKB74_04025, partial [Lentisphaeria bacterium]|nr:hypothetical protein [Lentisphaeria bacterium]